MTIEQQPASPPANLKHGDYKDKVNEIIVEVNNSTVFSVNELSNVDAKSKEDYKVFLSFGGRSGNFTWSNSGLITEVLNDPLQGIYVAPSTDPTGSSGAWVRKLNGFVSPEMFGAIGDGVNDDTLANQAAIDFGMTYKQNPLKTYLVDTMLLRANLAIDGDATSKIKCKNTITAANLKDIKIINCNLEYGEDTPNGLTIVKFEACENVIIEKCVINGLGYSGNTPLATGANVGIALDNCTNVEIFSCDVGNFKNNWGIQLEDSTDVTIKYNTVHHTGRAGIEVTSGNENVKVLYNNLDYTKTNHINVDAYDGCIDLYGPSNNTVLIQGNTIKNGGGTGSDFSGLPVPATGVRVSGSTNVEVCSNEVITGDGIWGVFVTQNRDSIISHSVNYHNNLTQIDGGVSYGYRHLSGTNISFNNNKSRATTSAGVYTNQPIEFRNDAKNVVVKGNIFEGFDGGLATSESVGCISFHPSGTAFSNIIVSGNVSKCYSTGVSLNHCDMFTVADNIIEYDQSAAGIDVAATSSNGIITGNCIKRPTNPNISIDAGATNVQEVNNILAIGVVP